jgi:hypothetical protein
MTLLLNNNKAFHRLQVWVNYTKLAQLLLPADQGCPIGGAEPLGENYPEYLMAAIVVACKCCSNWTR